MFPIKDFFSKCDQIHSFLLSALNLLDLQSDASSSKQCLKTPKPIFQNINQNSKNDKNAYSSQLESTQIVFNRTIYIQFELKPGKLSPRNAPQKQSSNLLFTRYTKKPS